MSIIGLAKELAEKLFVWVVVTIAVVMIPLWGTILILKKTLLKSTPGADLKELSETALNLATEVSQYRERLRWVASNIGDNSHVVKAAFQDAYHVNQQGLNLEEFDLHMANATEKQKSN